MSDGETTKPRELAEIVADGIARDNERLCEEIQRLVKIVNDAPAIGDRLVILNPGMLRQRFFDITDSVCRGLRQQERAVRERLTERQEASQ